MIMASVGRHRPVQAGLEGAQKSMNVAFYWIFRDHRHIDSMPGLWLPGLAASQITREPLFTLVLSLRGSSPDCVSNSP
jgi:hypothetical protein